MKNIALSKIRVKIGRGFGTLDKVSLAFGNLPEAKRPQIAPQTTDSERIPADYKAFEVNNGRDAEEHKHQLSP